MLFEIRLYVKQRMAGRVTVGDGEIIAVVENGQRRTLKSESFKETLQYIMDETDLKPVGQPERIGTGSYFVTWRYTYRKPEVYVQAEYDRWACAYPVDNHWMVKRASKDTETRFRTKTEAMTNVDAWVGYDYVSDLHRKTVDKDHKTRRELGG